MTTKLGVGTGALVTVLRQDLPAALQYPGVYYICTGTHANPGRLTAHCDSPNGNNRIHTLDADGSQSSDITRNVGWHREYWYGPSMGSDQERAEQHAVLRARLEEIYNAAASQGHEGAPGSSV